MSETTAARVAELVRIELRSRGVRQHTLAAVLGYSRQAFNRRVCGWIPFNVSELETIAAELELPLAHFVTLAADAAAYSPGCRSWPARPAATRQPEHLR